MSSVVEAQQLVRRIAAPAQIGDTIKRQIERASRRIPFWSTSRVSSAWYADPRMRVDADEIIRLRAIANEAFPEAIDELSELKARIARLEAALLVSRQDTARAGGNEKNKARG